MVEITVEISIEEKSWKKLDFDLKSTIESACFKTLEHLNVFPKDKPSDNKICEISILLTNDEHIKKLNKQYRTKDQPTNVLSFPMVKNIKKELNKNEFITLGDIVISYNTIERESKLQKKKFKNHLIHLIVHSILHLLGYKHSSDAKAEAMELTEIEVLKKLRIDNPYN